MTVRQTLARSEWLRIKAETRRAVERRMAETELEKMRRDIRDETTRRMRRI